MKIAIVIKRLTWFLVPKQKRLALREGYSVLVDLGWPASIITAKMCDKAEAGVMQRYVGIQSWTAYKEDWEYQPRADGKTLYDKTTEGEPAEVAELSVADLRQLS